MLFGHDTRMALGAAVALVNSAADPDTLSSVEDLADFFRTWGYTGSFAGDEAELHRVRALRPRLRELFCVGTEEAVPIVNAMLAAVNALPQLVRHEGYDWHIHAIAPDADLAHRIQVESAMAMIDVIRAEELTRFGRCADPTCGALVLDLSRNRSRRYCSTACGNRNAVAAYRARRGAGRA